MTDEMPANNSLTIRDAESDDPNVTGMKVNGTGKLVRHSRNDTVFMTLRTADTLCGIDPLGAVRIGICPLNIAHLTNHEAPASLKTILLIRGAK
ncbi:hypothetical protein K1T71_005071 [Dendrolimus kikuchii]|uniref:Uncharacterized protein n=1 Tax=Dendrolimus kikuchii TaxID=765133 RepID=A0ACC1D5Y0_9NEOP|nr:hypothetical protein K1T71_005071 [Dendrolimus kikuchii]